MKTSLHKHSFRTAGLALAIGLGLAAASHSSQAAIVQYTLSGGTIDGTLGENSFTAAVWSITATANTDDVITISLNEVDRITLWVSKPLITIGTGQTALTATLESFRLEAFYSGSPPAPTDYMFYNMGGGGTASISDSFGAYNDLKTIATITGDSGFSMQNIYTNSGLLSGSAVTIMPGTFKVSAASSTAVPEPGTFIPAAVLVMGAILRRRRSRSHCSGRATA